jgi:hypothetical protein
MSLRVGDFDPVALEVTITAPDGIDLTTVSAVSGTVHAPKGTTAEWEFDIEAGATATTMVVTHTMAADGSDLPYAGIYRAALRLTFPGDVVRRPSAVKFNVENYP